MVGAVGIEPTKSWGLNSTHCFGTYVPKLLRITHEERIVSSRVCLWALIVFNARTSTTRKQEKFGRLIAAGALATRRALN
jgi:hypothetical protein